MIHTETYRTRPDGVRLIRTYSDTGMALLQQETGVIYGEAIDVEDSGYMYTEVPPPNDPELDDSEALAAIVGGDLT